MSDFPVVTDRAEFRAGAADDLSDRLEPTAAPDERAGVVAARGGSVR